MMNLLGLALLLSSIAAASLFSPAPDPDRHVLREGHRLIVVEFERVLQRSSSAAASSAIEISDEPKEKFLDAASVLPNIGLGLSQPQKEKLPDHLKEQISSIFTDTKEKAVPLDESAYDTVKTSAEKARRKAAEVAESASAAAKTAVEKTKQKVAQVDESASDALTSAAEKSKQMAANASTSAADTALRAGKDVAGNITASAEKTADMAVEAARDLRRNLTDIMRRAWELGRDVAAYVGVGAVARSAAAVAHLLGFATAYGTCVWVTFASSHVLASALPRQQLAIVQSRLYPVYFRNVAVSVGAAIVGHFLGRGQLSGTERVQGYNLMAILATVLFNLFWLEPKATKAMYLGMKLEKEEGRDWDEVDHLNVPAAMPEATERMPAATATPISDAFAARREASKARATEAKKRLRKLNNYSSCLNAVALMGLSWHLVHLAQRFVSAGEWCE